MSATHDDDGLCPLCGRSSQCAIIAGADPLLCWCMTTPVAPASLARIPPQMRGKACLCPACAAGAPAADMMSTIHPPELDPAGD
ncbi:cysteine-rich CWC family protein [Delftia sp. PS-11]|uniref:cysteine-rich CWC family protein n=1 Tax=Delftia sp. PS-11 TaxID=2767222 RepID=UPI0024582E27|nr:cysteine-rich CWC family protein [Delftia sp. PS-11]KAJ8743131.1 cysteine-rich CWC family protein [Delftia sp. PS-11]